MRQNGILDFKKPTIITAQQYGTKVSVEIDHSDTDLDELMDAFQTLVTGLGYHDWAWKSWIVDRAAEYHEQDTEDLKKALTEWQNDEVADAVFHRDVKESVRTRSDVRLTEMMEDDEQLGLYDDEWQQREYTEDSVDAAFAEHNAHEEGFDINSLDDLMEENYKPDSDFSNDGGFDGKPNKALKLAAKEFKKITKKNKKK